MLISEYMPLVDAVKLAVRRLCPGWLGLNVLANCEILCGVSEATAGALPLRGYCVIAPFETLPAYEKLA